MKLLLMLMAVFAMVLLSAAQETKNGRPPASDASPGDPKESLESSETAYPYYAYPGYGYYGYPYALPYYRPYLGYPYAYYHG